MMIDDTTIVTPLHTTIIVECMHLFRFSETIQTFNRNETLFKNEVWKKFGNHSLISPQINSPKHNETESK